MTRRRSDETKNLILMTALRLFSEQGVLQTTMRQISEDANVTQGALYWHFKNKDEVLQQLHLLHPFPLDQIYLDHLQAAQQDPVSALKGFLVDWVMLVFNNPTAGQVWRVFHSAGAQSKMGAELSEQVLEEQHRWMEKLAALVKKVKKSKQLSRRAKRQEALLPEVLYSSVGGVIDYQMRQKQFEPALHQLQISALVQGIAA